MNEIVGPASAIDLSALGTPELKTLLARSIEFTARHLLSLAAIWRELESRGEDLSGMRAGILEYIPMIAHHRLDARAIVNHAGQKTLLAALSRLPIGKQTDLLDAGYVCVAGAESDGQEAQKPLSGLTAREIYLVFSEDRVRSIAEQQKLLRAQANRAVFRAKPKARKTRQIDIDNGVLTLGANCADLKLVVDKLSEYFGKDIAGFLKNG